MNFVTKIDLLIFCLMYFTSTDRYNLYFIWSKDLECDLIHHKKIQPLSNWTAEGIKLDKTVKHPESIAIFVVCNPTAIEL